MAYARFYRTVRVLECQCFTLDENKQPKKMHEKHLVYGTFQRDYAQNVLRRRLNDKNLIITNTTPKKVKVGMDIETFLKYGYIIDEKEGI